MVMPIHDEGCKSSQTIEIRCAPELFTRRARPGQKGGPQQISTPFYHARVRGEVYIWLALIPISSFQYAVVSSRHLGASGYCLRVAAMWRMRRDVVFKDSQRREKRSEEMRSRGLVGQVTAEQGRIVKGTAVGSLAEDAILPWPVHMSAAGLCGRVN